MPVKTVPSVIIGSGSNKSIVNNIYNNDFGNTIITGYLTVDFYLTVDGNLTVGGAFQLSGDITVKNPSNVTVFSVDSDTGDTLTKGDITVKNSSDVTKFSVDSDTGNTTIEGDLTVNGTTTTIDSVTLVVEDPVITLAKNANSNPTASTDAGLFLQRGSTENPAIIIWNETLNQFEVATVTGASSTTTNFTGGGVTKTFATFKAGGMYGSTIDIGGLGSFGSLSSGSLAIGEHTYTSLGIFLGEYGNLNIHSIQDYSSIILNHDVTSGIPSANAVIEVKRGSSTSAKITWNEGSDIWDFNQSVNLSSGGFSVNTSSFNVSSAGITQIGTNGYLQIAKASSGGKNAIYLNSDASGTPPSNQSASIVVWRGSSPAASLTWSELNTRWQIDNLYIQSNLEVTGTSTFTGDLFLGDTTNIFVNKPSVSTTPVIKLNRDETGSPTSDVIAIEVERGTSSNALLKWDEYNNNWDINTNLYSQKIRIRTDETSGSTSRVYIYFTNPLGIFSENVYFYIYKTSNSGVTREVVPITIVSTTRLQSYTSNGYSEVRFNNNLAYSLHANADAFIDMEDGVSYYININSTNASGLSPTVSFLFRYNSNEGNSGYTYTTVANADFIATGGYNGLIQVNNATNLVTQAFSAGTTIYDNVDNLPALSLEYSKGIGSIVLNSGVTDTPTDASILVDRGGLSSPATLLWDESQTSWVINQNIRLIADGVNSSSLYLQDSGSVWINDGILALESRSSNTTRIYLNSELTVGDTPTTDAKITVNRGNQTNAEIIWDETNDRWDFNYGLYLNTDSQLKIEKPTTPSTTPAILLNADRTGSGEEADVIAIEVERGILSNAKIKWDEGSDRWDFNSNVYLSSDVVLNTSSLNTTTINGTANFEHDVNLGNGSSKSIAINGTATFNSKLILGISNLTISAAGAVTVTNAYHKIDTYSSAATDDLDTINGGVEGMILVLQSVISTREVVVRDTGGGTGNIRLSTADFHLNNVQDTLTLIYNGSLWCELCRSDNA